MAVLGVFLAFQRIRVPDSFCRLEGMNPAYLTGIRTREIWCLLDRFVWPVDQPGDLTGIVFKSRRSAEPREEKKPKRNGRNRGFGGYGEAGHVHFDGKEIYRVGLADEERDELGSIVKGRAAAQKRMCACILLLADETRKVGPLTEDGIASVLDAGTSTVERARKRCVMVGTDAAIGCRE